ncbi:hypothetical protein HY484_02125 [Candidatus Woesearchaeota archaeon]|nr:hypothetical protein [Candidatus Woesearchaeota archaeon]
MNTKQEVLEHLVDSTAIATVTTPVLMTLETIACGMPAELSLNSRILGAVFGYAGLSYAFKKGRDIWRKHFNITETNAEKEQGFTDTAYATTYNLIFGAPFYLLAGARDTEQIIYATLLSTGAFLIGGWPIGYLMSLYGELTGVRPSERISPRIRELPPSLKKTLFVAITAASMVLSVGIYHAVTQYQQTQQTQMSSQK